MCFCFFNNIYSLVCFIRINGSLSVNTGFIKGVFQVFDFNKVNDTEGSIEIQNTNKDNVTRKKEYFDTSYDNSNKFEEK